jgi:type VI protein secretion system component VasF
MAHRRHKWTEDLDVQSIQTPAHAQNRPIVIQRVQRDPKIAKRIRTMLFSFALALCFCMGLIVFFYNHQYFIPLIVVGSVGIFTVSALLFNDFLLEK